MTITVSFESKMSYASMQASESRSSGGRGFDSHRGQKIFSLPRVVP